MSGIGCRLMKWRAFVSPSPPDIGHLQTPTLRVRLSKQLTYNTFETLISSYYTDIITSLLIRRHGRFLRNHPEEFV